MPKHFDFRLLLVILIAALFRLYQPGIIPTWLDELNLIDSAIRLSRHGEWLWLGNPASTGFLTGHSPFSVYVTAIPALFFPNPIALRIFFALLGILSIALVYLLARRYLGVNVALIAALFLSVMPLPLYWSRIVWNPNLAPLFIVIWLFTARGYFENKPFLQFIHWLALSFTIQSQSAMLILLPLSIALFSYGAWEQKGQIRLFLWRHFQIFTLSLITCLPWFYGLYGSSQGWFGIITGPGKADAGDLGLNFPNLSTVLNNFALLTSSFSFRETTMNMSDARATWWIPDFIQWVFIIQSLIIAAGIIVLIVYGIIHRSHRFLAFLAFSSVWPLAYFIFNRPISDFYLMPLVYSSIIVFAIVVDWLCRRWPLLWTVVMICFLSQIWLSLSVYDWYKNDSHILSYDDIIAMVAAWTANGREVLVWEYEPEMSKVEAHEWRSHWRIFSEEYPIRFITEANTLVIDPDGQNLIVDEGSLDLLAGLEPQERFENYKRVFISAFQNPLDFPDPRYLPLAANQFADMIQILGLDEVQELDSQTWRLSLQWMPMQSTSEIYSFSLRLYDSDGQSYGQADTLSLSPELWRAGDYALTYFTLSLPTPFLSDATLHWQLLAYSPYTGDALPVVDAAGNSPGTMMQLEDAMLVNESNNN
jgi:4-amino-4-deoxy-L-arabinose transferase-like glycosyltransferase